MRSFIYFSLLCCSSPKSSSQSGPIVKFLTLTLTSLDKCLKKDLKHLVEDSTKKKVIHSLNINNSSIINTWKKEFYDVVHGDVQEYTPGWLVSGLEMVT